MIARIASERRFAMGDRRRVFLARNGKTNFHSLFEVVPSGGSGMIHGVLDMDTMNALVQWKNLDELVAVLGRTGPVIFSDVYKEVKRLVPIADVVEICILFRAFGSTSRRRCWRTDGDVFGFEGQG